MNKDSLGTRIKEYYENRAKTYLTRRTPVIIRLDGRAFHTFTKGCVKPYDYDIIKTMQDTTEYLIKNIQGAKVAYVESDEISLLVTDYDEIETDAWFDYSVQKICSITAAMASVKFTEKWNYENVSSDPEDYKPAYFDSRCFNIPKEEVINYFRWRYIDWRRNSIAMLAQANFSHKQLHGKGRADQLQMLLDKGIDWGKEEAVVKFGTTFVKVDGEYRKEYHGWMDDQSTLLSYLKETYL